MFENINCNKLTEEIDKSIFFDITLLENHLEACGECNKSIEIQEIYQISEKIKSLKKIKTSDDFIVNLDKKIDEINLGKAKENLLSRIFSGFKGISLKSQIVSIACILIVFLGVFNFIKFFGMEHNNLQFSKNTKELIVYNHITKYMMKMNIADNSQDKTYYLLRTIKPDGNKFPMIMYNDKL